MGYATHVGRVGALAVALGVGFGLGGSPAIAIADETTNTSDSPTADSSPGTEKDTAPPTAHDVDAGDADHNGGETPSSEDTDDNVESIDGPSGTGLDADGDDDVVGTDPTNDSQSEAPDDAIVSPARSQRKHTPWRTASRPDHAAARGTQGDPAPRRLIVPPVTRVAPQPPPVVAASPTAVPPPAVLTVASLNPPPPAEPPADETTAVSLSSVLAPLFGADGSGAPVETPALWVLLAAARRQLGQNGRRLAPGAAGLLTAAAAANTNPTAGEPIVNAPNGSGVVTGTVAVSDADGDALASAVTKPAKGAVTVTRTATGFAFTYTPTPAARHAASATNASAAAKQDTFTITVSDSKGGSVAVPITVQIKPANADPTATVSASPGLLTSNVYGSVKGKDADKDTLTYTASPTAKGGEVTLSSNGSFTYKPSDAARHAASADNASAATKTDTFTVTVTDGHGGVATVVVSVPIEPANAKPGGLKSTEVFTNPNSGRVTGKITGMDPDGDSFTYRAPAATADGAVTINTDGTFTYTPTAAARTAASKKNAPFWDKTDTFKVTVNDGHGGTTTLTVKVTIAPLGHVNQAPGGATVVVNQPNSSTGKVTGTVAVTDPERDTLTYTGPAVNAKGTVVIDGIGNFTFTPTDAARHQASATNATAADKQYSFAVTVTDGYGGSVTVPVTVSIRPSTNSSPANGTYSSTTDANGKVTGTATATDPENDTLTYGGSITTTKGSAVVNANGTFTYTPTDTARHNAAAVNASAADKSDSFTITVTDGHGGTTTIPVTVTILGANADPANGTYTSSTDSNGKVTGTASAGDANSDTLTYSGTITTTKGTAVVNPNGTFTYTPTDTARHNAAAVGASAATKTDSFTITVTDGHGGTTTIPVSVTILAKNATPTFTVGQGQANMVTGVVVYGSSYSDGDGDAPIYSTPASGAPAHGTVTVSVNGVITYTPDLNYFGAREGGGTDVFSVTADDGHGETVTRTITYSWQPPQSVRGDIAVPIQGGDDPWFAAFAYSSVSPDGTRAYQGTFLTDPATGDITGARFVAIDLTTGVTVGNPVLLSGVDYAYPPEFSPDGALAFITAETRDYTGPLRVVVVDPKTNNVLSTTSLGEWAQISAVVFSPDGAVGYIAVEDSTSHLYRVVPKTGSIDTVGIPLPGHELDWSVLYSGDGKRAIITSYEWDPVGKDYRTSVSVIDTVTNELQGSIAMPTLGAPPWRSTVLNSDGTRAVVITQGASTTAYIVDTSNRAVLGPGVDVDSKDASAQATFSADGSRVFVQTSSYDTVTRKYTVKITVLDSLTGQMIGTPAEVTAQTVRYGSYYVDGNKLFIAYSTDLNASNASRLLIVNADSSTSTVVLDGDPWRAIPSNGKSYILTDSGNATKLYTLDVATGTLIGAPTVINNSWSASLTVNDESHRGLLVNRVAGEAQQSVTILDLDTGVVVNASPVVIEGDGLTSVTFNAAGTHAFLVTYELGDAENPAGTTRVTVVDVVAGRALGTVAFAGQPAPTLTVNAAETLAFQAVDTGDSNVHIKVIDISSATPGASIL